MARRGRRVQQANIDAARVKRQAAQTEPEGLGQARTWDRKKQRYVLAGLCEPCAAKAAWGHAIGFQKIEDPCVSCQPIVNAFPDEGPRGSKWRKCLIKLEYMDPDQIAEVLSDEE